MDMSKEASREFLGAVFIVMGLIAAVAAMMAYLILGTSEYENLAMFFSFLCVALVSLVMGPLVYKGMIFKNLRSKREISDKKDRGY